MRFIQSLKQVYFSKILQKKIAIALQIVLCGMCNYLVPSHAQTWPTKPIKFIIPFPPGDSIDITTRMISPKLTEILGQPIIVENVAGGSGSIGINNLVRAAPDGYTFASGQTGIPPNL